MNRIRARTKTGESAKRGFLSFELVLTLPILGIVLLGLFEFAVLFFARGTLVEASRVAARKASLPGVTVRDVKAEVRRVVSPRLARTARIDVDLGEQAGDVVRVAVNVPMNQAAPDLLWPIGFRLRGRSLHSETRMIKE